MGWGSVVLFWADKTGAPACRLFNSYEAGPAALLSTTSEAERDVLGEAHYRYEGIG